MRRQNGFAIDVNQNVPPYVTFLHVRSHIGQLFRPLQLNDSLIHSSIFSLIRPSIFTVTITMSGSASKLTPSDVTQVLQCAWAYARENEQLPGVSDVKMWKQVVLHPVRDIVKKVSISHITQ